MSEAFDAAVFYPAFRAAGIGKLATVKMRGGAAVDVWIRYASPDESVLGGAGQSKQYEIEYQRADLPRLAEGDAVTVWTDETKSSGTKFKVRQSPYEAPGEASDGFFWRALLTKQGA